MPVSSSLAFSASPLVLRGVSTYLLPFSDVYFSFSIPTSCLDETSQMACLYELFNLIFQDPIIFRCVPKIAVVSTLLGLIRTLWGGSPARCSQKIDIEGFFQDSRPFDCQRGVTGETRPLGKVSRLPELYWSVSVTPPLGFIRCLSLVS